ncbi:MAG TPA: type I 3-dehydroquinate dehydratase [Candidatus Lokiarchaeia archaeon]|nr:type I 3-dehydroquinate dehydratase [Candidatus Lokiarchaeia archaeon]
MKKLPIIVALPVTEDKVISGALANEIEQIVTSAARCVELRLDYAKDVTTIDIAEIVRSIQDNGLDAICTCRVEAEGGEFHVANQESHEAILKTMIPAAPRYVDIELSTDKDLLQVILDASANNGVGVILSIHDFDRTPRLDEIDDFLQSIVDKVAVLSVQERESIIMKIIFMAMASDDNIVPMKVIESLSGIGFKVISFCMGMAGTISRVASVLPKIDGKPAGIFTYASLDESTAPGQFNLKTMEAILAPFF